MVLVIGVMTATLLLGCKQESRVASTHLQTPRFSESAEPLGIAFKHKNGMNGSLFFNEVVGPGLALLDADDDGDLDVFIPQGHRLPAREAESGAALDGGRLFLNSLCKSRRNCSSELFRFVDGTEDSGLRATGYGMGVAVGDPNNDGLPDLYLTNFGANQLWINGPPGRFSKVHGDAALVGSAWSTSAVFFDLGGDGDDDLYVTNYVKYDTSDPKSCADLNTGSPDYCGPQGFTAEADLLFVNRDGRLAHSSEELGITAAMGKGLGVVELDADQDGASDLFVANDLMENFLWLWRSDRFVESGALAGLATNSMGAVEASMGIAVGDVDSDGREDLLSAHLEGETNTLYRNLGGGVFLDASQPSRLGAWSLPFTAFGTTFSDFNMDGHLDAVVANGAVTIYNDKVRRSLSRGMEQPNQLFLGGGDGVFSDVSEDAGLRDSFTSRGLASGDLDNDGDIDIVIANNNGPLQLLVNLYQQSNPSPWVGLELVRSNGASALGATLRRMTETGPSGPIHRVRRGDSYLSSKDPRIVFPALGADTFEVRWPDGTTELRGPFESHRYHRLIQGQAADNGNRSGR